MLDLKKIYFIDILQWSLIPLIISLLTLSFIENLSQIVILFGFTLSLMFLFYFLYYQLNIQTEVIVYFAWIIWSLSGAFIASNFSLYVDSLLTIIQIGALLFLISGIVAKCRNLTTIFISFIIAGVIISLTSFQTGEFNIAADVEEKFQVTSITQNANSFAYHMLFFIFAVFYFWKRKLSILWNSILLGLAFVGVSAIIYSGSRKGFLGLIAFILLWIFFCYNKKNVKNLYTKLISLMLLFGLIYFTIFYFIPHTYIGKRFEQTQVDKEVKRIQMYKDGFKMIFENPITGVGLDNYRVYSSSGKYSHSDYIEVAANTGIVGFILYFSIYIILWRRFNRIKLLTKNSNIIYTIGLLKAAILTILLLALGRPNINSKLTWIFIASAIGYSWSKNKELSLSMDENSR